MGSTSLIGGTRVMKNSVRLEAYGTIDELNSFLGMIRSFEIAKENAEELVMIQNILFDLGGNLATDPQKDVKIKLGLNEDDIKYLENAIDRMDTSIPPLKVFVLPGGSEAISFCHIARTVCRRAERRILDLHTEHPVDELIIKYINRLSDYLFVLSRKIAFDNKVEEQAWIPLKR